ncbi:MAG: type I restriction enzyme HsdR N-terminal domain-containing protein [Lentimicrobiaceae bacterium]|jgi:type I site-specific restriction-modification system R (restriction) subunit|nr:type I restriction enzyme HsdR N-terminal domain-containing protein [Lentimicrobiaceae bacterium]
MIPLNLPEYTFTTRTVSGKTEIFDDIRKRFVALTPEEWVRQHFIKYLVIEKQYPKSLIAVEMNLKVIRRAKRSDIVVFGRNGIPMMVVECKAPHIKISQKAFDQVARYNMTFNVRFLVVTNGLEHYCCKIDFAASQYSFLDFIPDFQQIQQL